MRGHLVVGLLALGVVGVAACGAGEVGSWQLVWSEEFDGDALDAGTWEPMIGTGAAYGLPHGWGNNEQQYYTDLPDNLSVEDGWLNITAREQQHMGWSYTSARIRSMGGFEARYGRIEARIALPSGAGIWPAFWMLPTDSPYGGWAAGGEIDIIESVNTADTAYGTLHFGGQWPNNTANGGTLNLGGDVGGEPHVFAIEWEPYQMRWYVDDVLYSSLTYNLWWSENAPGHPLAPFDSPFHLILNVAVGGDFPGPPNGGSPFPMTMEVDYIRVYERVQGPFGGEPRDVPGLIEAEDFDEGGAGWAYHDLDPINTGGAYRPVEGVDIEACADAGGGFNIGWVDEGEWLEYTVDVRTAGLYRVTARCATPLPGAGVRIESDANPASAVEMNVPPTGGWQSWEGVEGVVRLEAGEQVLRLTPTGGTGLNINWIRFLRMKPAPVPDPLSTGEPELGSER